MDPTYRLVEVQARVAKLGASAFPKKTLDLAQVAFGMTTAELIAFILSRRDTTCYKTMPSISVPGAMQDIYHWTTPSGKVAYVKVSLHPKSKVVIQFKEK